MVKLSVLTRLAKEGARRYRWVATRKSWLVGSYFSQLLNFSLVFQRVGESQVRLSNCATSVHSLISFEI